MGSWRSSAIRRSKEDAIACVSMAIAVQRWIRELQHKSLDLGSEKPFQLRIGINTGFCTVGNFGSEDRMDYTIIGNEVNLAARVRSHAQLGGILDTHETSSLIKNTILTEEHQALSVTGFAHPVRVYRVVGTYDELEKDGRIIQEERGGFRLLVDLTNGDQATAIAAVENVLPQLKGRSAFPVEKRYKRERRGAVTPALCRPVTGRASRNLRRRLTGCQASKSESRVPSIAHRRPGQPVG